MILLSVVVYDVPHHVNIQVHTVIGLLREQSLYQIAKQFVGNLIIVIVIYLYVSSVRGLQLPCLQQQFECVLKLFCLVLQQYVQHLLVWCTVIQLYCLNTVKLVVELLDRNSVFVKKQVIYIRRCLILCYHILQTIRLLQLCECETGD